MMGTARTFDRFQVQSLDQQVMVVARKKSAAPGKYRFRQNAVGSRDIREHLEMITIPVCIADETYACRQDWLTGSPYRFSRIFLSI
jgi:hypothetical protein